MQGFIPFSAQTSSSAPIAMPEGTSSTAQRGRVQVAIFSPTPTRVPSADAFLDRYTHSGIKACTEINGGCTALVIDSERSEVYIAIDFLGINSLSYAVTDEGVHFAQQPLAIAKQLGINKVSRQQLYNFLFFHMIPAPASIFADIKKLEGGCYLKVKDRALSIERYWRPNFSAEKIDRITAENELLRLLRAAVARNAEDSSVGAFLSGGLDSSSVSGCLAEYETDSAKTFSIGFGVEGYDELEYARIANSHFGCQGHELVATPSDIVQNFSRIAAAYGEPFGNSSVVPTLLCAQLAKSKDVSVLLAGDGGDELFAGNERYLKQLVFERYFKIPSPLRSGLLSPLAGALRDEHPIWLLRKFKSYVEQAEIPLPRRFETWNYAYREGIESMLTPEFAKNIEIEHPMQAMEAAFADIPSDDLVDKMLVYDWKFTLADSDLRKVGQMCALAGVEVRYPMLDKDLIEFSTRIPTSIKLAEGKLRSFYKSATQGFLPDAILNKPKHGFGLPFGIWRQQDKDLSLIVDERLERMRQRGIFKDEFMNQLSAPSGSGAESYLGYFVWDLMVLEEWLTCHQLEL